MKKNTIDGMEIYTTTEFNTKTDWAGVAFLIIAGVLIILALSYVLGDINNYLTQIIK